MRDPREDQEVTEHPLANYPKPPPRGEDLPYSDGEPMESARHFEQMLTLILTLREAQDPERLYVGGNMFVYYSELQAKQNDFKGPDVFVVVGRPHYDRKSWVAWEEDGRLPDVIIELLSPSTEKVDRGEKFRIYRDVMKVSRYYLYDPFTYVLEGYALTDGEYVPIEPNATGRLPCAPLGLELGIHHSVDVNVAMDRLRWFDADGRPLPTGRELAEAARRDARDAQAMANTAEAKAQGAEAKAHDAEAKAQDAEAKAQDAEAKAQDAEAKAQDAEAKAQDAEAKAQDAEAKAQDAEAKAQDAEAKAQDAEAKAQDAEARAAEAEARAEALARRLAELEGK